MTQRIATYVHADDPILQAGVVSQLRMRPEVEVVDSARMHSAEVAIIVADVLDDSVTRTLRAVQRNSVPRAIVVLSAVDDATLVAAAEAGVNGILRRHEATAESLIAAIQRIHRGDGVLPPDLLARLLGQVGRLQRQVLSPRGLHFSGLSDREIQVLRLVADGRDTNEIATELCYSQRTVKNVLHDVTSRLQLRNRSHAVAYAVREGLI